MTFHASAGRRLSTDKLATFQAGTDNVGSAGRDLRGAACWPCSSLKIMVTTKRLPKNDINTLMRTFLTDPAAAADP